MATIATSRPKLSQPRTGGLSYDAFISYSHAADGHLAPAVQAGLQSLAKRWYRRRALRVFRDKTSLAASPELWPAIEGALSRAGHFVLLASPEAAASHWVEQEVRWWRTHRSHDTVLIALTDGELRWDDATGDFDAAAAIPPGLRGWFPIEPLWVDLRWARDERDVSMRNPHFRDSVGELAAPLHGLPKDELIGEDISQHRRTLRLARSAVALLVLLLAIALVGGVVALIQRNHARDQSELAVAGQLSATGVANLEDRLDVAELLAAEGHSRRDTPQTTAALFKAATASPHLARFAENGTRVTALTPAAGEERVFTGGQDGSVRSWSLDRDRVGPPLARLKRPITVLQTSENGRFLAAGDESGAVSVIDLRDRNVAHASVKGRVDAVAVTDDGRRLAAAWDDFHVALKDLRQGQEQEVDADTVVQSLAFRDHARTLMVGGFDGSVQTRFVPTLDPLGEPTRPRTPAGNYTAAYSADGRQFGFYKFGVWVWSTGAAGPKLVFPISSSGGATALAIASDASRAAVATAGTISIVAPRLKGHGRYSIGAQPGGLVTDPMTGISGRTGLLAFAGSNQRLVSSSGSLLALWDVEQESRIATPLPARLPDLTTASVPPGLAVARSGRLVAWASEEPEVGIWSPQTGARALPISDGFVIYGAVGLSGDGRHVAAAGSDGIQIWDVARPGAPVTVPSSGRLANMVQALEPDTSPDSMFAVWGNGRIDRLSLGAARLRPLARPLGRGTPYMNALAFAPRAGVAAMVMDGRMSMIDLATGRRSAGPKLGLESVSAAALSGDGRLLAAADGDETLVLWDLRRDRAVRRTAVGRVLQVAFDPRARFMATLTGEGLMAVWDVASGTKLGEVELRELGGAFASDRGDETSLRFSADGDLWTATAGGRLIRWAMSPAAWSRSVCRTVNRSLTESEWNRYVGTGGSARFSCSDR